MIQVFLLAASVLAFELALMRVLLVASWHHFAFLVISVALLGFGAAGTVLTFFRKRLLSAGVACLFWLAVATAASMPLSIWIAQWVPITSRFLPSLFWRQSGGWLLYWLTLFIPFFLGAAGIGLALMRAGKEIPRVYAGNLLGSGVGVVLATVGMWLLDPALLAAAAGCLALGSALCVPWMGWPKRVGVVSLAALLSAALIFVTPLEIRSDPYKYQSYLQQLQRQGLARQLAGTIGPKGVAAVHQSDLFHDLPFYTGAQSPPPMHVVTLDGHLAAVVPDLRAVQEAGFLRQTLSAAAYELISGQPSVLLLGDLGAANAWLAAFHGAVAIHVVHDHPQVHGLVRGSLQNHGAGVFDQPATRYIDAHPRHYVDHAAVHYDLIHLTAFESMAAGGGGIVGLGQDSLLTVEGIAACIERLYPQGLLVVSRGIQDPPRDNLKILATVAQALRSRGVEEPGRHLVVFRDYLAVCTLVKATPWQPAELGRVAALIEERHLTGVWFSDIPPGYLNQPDHLPGPPGDTNDWYATAAPLLFSHEAKSFIHNWVFDIRPATDHRPFFHDFSKLGSLPLFKAAFGDLWLTRTELAYVFVLIAAIAVGLVAALSTLVPLLFLKPGVAAANLASIVGFFSCLGLAYLMLEMAFLSKTTHIVGDPVQGAAVTIAAFLVFSGLGSWSIRGRGWSPRRFSLLVVGLAAAAILVSLGAAPLARAMGGGPLVMRYGAAVLLIAPLAFLMGFPMPIGLARLQSSHAPLFAWAWGINGFASVLAAPVAMLLAMVWGFQAVALLAAAAYPLAAVFYWFMGPGHGLKPSQS
jgi:hypothetical protein